MIVYLLNQMKLIAVQLAPIRKCEQLTDNYSTNHLENVLENPIHSRQ